MPTEKLAEAKARSAQPKPKLFKLGDGHGLFLWVFPTGAKRWRLTYRHEGKAKEFALGLYPEVGIAEARTKAADRKDIGKRNRLSRLVGHEFEDARSTVDLRDSVFLGGDGGWPIFIARIASQKVFEETCGVVRVETYAARPHRRSQLVVQNERVVQLFGARIVAGQE